MSKDKTREQLIAKYFDLIGRHKRRKSLKKKFTLMQRIIILNEKISKLTEGEKDVQE